VEAIMVLEKPSSLLTEHDGLIHFDKHLLDHRLRQSVPLQCLIIECIERYQYFALCERCLPKGLLLPCHPPGGFREVLHRLVVVGTWLHSIPGHGAGRAFSLLSCLAPSKDLFIYAKDLLVEANDERVRQHRPPWRASRVGGKKLIGRLSTKAKVEDRKSVTSSARPTSWPLRWSAPLQEQSRR